MNPGNQVLRPAVPISGRVLPFNEFLQISEVKPRFSMGFHFFVF